VDKNIETLATALYVKIDDLLLAEPWLAPQRPEGSMPVTVSDSELVAMAVMSALLAFRSERRWLRYASAHLTGMFPRQLGQSGYNKRLRKMIFLLMTAIRRLGMDTSLWSDDVWVVDSTPVQCGCSRETVKRSDVAGWAGKGPWRFVRAVRGKTRLLTQAALPEVRRVARSRRVTRTPR
jgi:hypothetical protein